MGGHSVDRLPLQRFSTSLSSICSGFSKNLADAYGNFAWNLNVLPGMPHSVLKHVEGISGRAGGGVCGSCCYLVNMLSSCVFLLPPHTLFSPSGISMPWLYVGMMFSSFCWHVEDNFLYSINYMHFGNSKRWYGVPSSDAAKMEACFREHLPDEFAKNPLLLHDIVTQVG